MVASKSVLILGDGSAGITAANKLRSHAGEDELEITVIGKTFRHFYKPDGLFIPFGYKNYRDSIKPMNFLLNNGIDYIDDEILRVNPDDGIVFLRSGKSYVGDYIIIATGNRYAPEEIPGYDGEAKHFYSLQNAMELREYLNAFSGGNVVVGSTGQPIQSPQSLYEFSFLLDSYLTDKGVRAKSKITYLSPFSGVTHDEQLSQIIEPILKKKNIEYKTGFAVTSINPKNKEVTGSDGSKLNYNLLVLSPPHRGQEFLKVSGLTDQQGYVNVDPSTLTLKGKSNIFSIGDSNNLSNTKSSASGYMQASFVVARIISETVGGLSDSVFQQSTPQVVITGKDTAFSYVEAPGKKLRTIQENKGDFLLKWSASNTYFSTVLRGVV
ncbi:MAG: NAD(P)/FAD-dependent oxidoreductase [Candidatus Thermoplasmatota archaeon]|jgi:sulfide:quinone oxidoreductase|nr:NAD(P)/FAD-dependent oxidoreductase [Candidatus Thermoplasmatota archaeon]